MGEVLYGAGLLYPDLGLVFDDVSYAVPLLGTVQEGSTYTSMTLYNFLITSNYPQWIVKDIVLSIGMALPMDAFEGADTGTWFLTVKHMVADGEKLYLEVLGGGRSCSTVPARGTGIDCSTLYPIPITAICSLCMPEGERWDRCPPLPSPLPPAPPLEVVCDNNWEPGAIE